MSDEIIAGMQLGDSLGFAGIVVGQIGGGLALAYPTKRWIGFTLIGFGLVAIVAWAIMASREKPENPKGTPNISWLPKPIKSGDPLTSAQLNAVASVGSIPVKGDPIYDPALGATLPSGNQTLRVDFTFDDPAYNSASKTVTVEVLPKIASSPIAPAFRYKGVKYIEVDNNGQASLPVLFTVAGVETLQVRGSSYVAAAVLRASTPEGEVLGEELFWADFERKMRSAGPTVVTTAAQPNREAVINISLGQNISESLPRLKDSGGVIYVGLRVRDTRGNLLEQTCLVVNVATNYDHLCSRHNVP